MNKKDAVNLKRKIFLIKCEKYIVRSIVFVIFAISIFFLLKDGFRQTIEQLAKTTAFTFMAVQIWVLSIWYRHDRLSKKKAIFIYMMD